MGSCHHLLAACCWRQLHAGSLWGREAGGGEQGGPPREGVSRAQEQMRGSPASLPAHDSAAPPTWHSAAASCSLQKMMSTSRSCTGSGMGGRGGRELRHWSVAWRTSHVRDGAGRCGAARPCWRTAQQRAEPRRRRKWAGGAAAVATTTRLQKQQTEMHQRPPPHTHSPPANTHTRTHTCSRLPSCVQQLATTCWIRTIGKQSAG